MTKVTKDTLPPVEPRSKYEQAQLDRIAEKLEAVKADAAEIFGTPAETLEGLLAHADLLDAIKAEYGSLDRMARAIVLHGAEAVAARLGLLDDSATEEVEVTRDAGGRKLARPRIVKRARDAHGRFVSKAKADKRGDDGRDAFGRRQESKS